MKKNFNIVLMVLILLFIFAFGAQGVYANSQEVVNNVSTGVVNIEIDEYTLNEKGEEVPWIDGVDVLPGMTISKIPYFTATGNDCFIRATIVADGVKAETPIAFEHFKGISKDWVQVGEYYYYMYPLKTNESIDFFHSFVIPSDWANDANPSDVGDWNFSIKIIVDAVQAENFAPNFTSNAPWGDIVIEDSIHKNGYDINVFTSNSETNMSIIIEDNDNVITAPNDLFHGFKTLMPGDILTDSVEINSKKHCKLFLTTESIADVELLQKLQLQIILVEDANGKVLYNGTMDSQITDMLIGEFEKGETGTLMFTVLVPEELNNAYALRNGSVKWVFDARDVGINNDSPQTGDNSFIALYISMMICSGSALVVLLIYSIKKRRNGVYVQEDL